MISGECRNEGVGETRISPVAQSSWFRLPWVRHTNPSDVLEEGY